MAQAALQLEIPREELPLSDPVPPRTDFVDDGLNVYSKAVSENRYSESNCTFEFILLE